MEHKQFDAVVTDIDEDQGIVETIFAVMGNIDEGKDRIWPGSFTKTWAERAPQIRVMDQHNISSIMNVLGKPLGFKELGRDELPASLLEKFPEATGGAWAQVQFLMDTPEGKGAFSRIKAKAINEWSFGYDSLDFDYETVKAAGGEDMTVRNLRTIKLYELSPVVWGMNPATMTTDVKAEPVIEPDAEPVVRKFVLIIDGVELELEDEQKQAITELITAPAEQAAIETNIEQAGPDAESAPPTSTLSIAEIEMTLTKLHLLEVGNDYISREV